MTAAETLLHKARSGEGVTQSALGRRVGIPQARVSEIERGRFDPSVERLVKLIAASRHTLALLPTPTPPVYEAADEVSELLERGDDRRAFRRFIQLSDDLAREPLDRRAALACLGPSPTGHSGYDAAIAALVEFRLAGAKRACPSWVDDDWRVCEEGWCPSGDAVLAEYSRATAPEPFRRRGVYISADDLASV